MQVERWIRIGSRLISPLAALALLHALVQRDPLPLHLNTVYLLAVCGLTLWVLLRHRSLWRFSDLLWAAAALWLALTGGFWGLQLSASTRPEEVPRRLETALAEIRARFAEELEPLERLHTRTIRALSRASGQTEDVADPETVVLSGISLADDEGMSLYAPDGTLLFWAGQSAPAPEGIPVAADVEHLSYDIFLQGEQAHLIAAGQYEDGRILVVERSLDLDDLRAAPGSGGAHPSVSIELLLRDSERSEIDRWFLQGNSGDQRWGRGPQPTLFFPLRSPDGTVLAVATLRDASPAERQLAIAGLWQDLGALGVALLLLVGLRRALIGFPAVTGPGSLVGASTLLWSTRWVLSASGFPHIAFLIPWFNYRDYTSQFLEAWSDASLASPAVWGARLLQSWTHSPGDLFLTAVFTLIQATLLYAAAGRLIPMVTLTRRRTILGWLILAGGSVLLIAGFGHFVTSVARDASHSLIEVSWYDLRLPVVILQASLFTTAAALVFSLLALARWACRRCLRWEDRPWLSPLDLGRRTLIAGFLAITAVTLAYYPLVYKGSETRRKGILEENVLDHVRHQRSRREVVLREALEKAVRDAELLTLTSADVRDVDPELAYRIWSRTELALQGLDSSLRLVDRQHNVLSRFGLNLPAAFEHILDRSILAGPGPVRTFVSNLSTQKPVLFGRRKVAQKRAAVHAVEIILPDDFDNIDFRFSSNPYSLLFRPTSHLLSWPELLDAPSYLFVYNAESLEPIFSSDPATPPSISKSIATRLKPGGKGTWRSVRHGEQNLRLLYAREGEEIYAIGYRKTSVRRLLAGWLQLVLQNVVLALLLSILLGISIAPPVTRRVAHSLLSASAGRSMFRQLLIALLLASLIPLVSLSLFLETMLSQEIRQDVRRTGDAALTVGGRVVADYITSVSASEQTLNDTLIYWLSQLIRQDLHIYNGADLLASSRRELFASGLLSTRLRGETYRELMNERMATALHREQIGDESFYIISGRINLPPPYPEDWILSLPLGLQQEEMAGKLHEAREAVLLSTSLLFLLLSLLAYAAAVRLSRPLRDLSAAAGRMARGDLEVHVEHRSEAELEALIDAFNRMAHAIRNQQEDLRSRRDYIEKILLNATTGVISFDSRGCIVTVNPAARLLTGLSLDIGAGLRQALMDGVVPGLADLLPEPGVDSTTSHEIRERREEVDLTTEGEQRCLRAVLVPLLEGGEPTGGLLLLEDITENIRSNRLRAWAEMAQRFAHEIKNPLTPIQLSAEHLRHVFRDRPKEFESVLEDCLRTITGQVTQLRHIAREFSTYARIPELRLERVDLREVLDETLLPYVSSAPEGLNIERQWGEDPVYARVDRNLLQRAVVNLIENSLEACENKGTIRVELESVADHEGLKARIAVEDDGPGIEAAALPRLFEPFFSTKGSGTGLGLAIARQAVEANGGTIAVEQRPDGRGTRMVIQLPSEPA